MLFDCVFNVWTPKIGDPHVMGWVTVAAYFGAALLALFVVFRIKYISLESHEKRDRLFWWLLVLLLVFLGVNKQLDLQSFFTAVGRCSAKLGGWYADRREIQYLFILSIGGVFSVVGLFLVWFLRMSMSHNWQAIVGVSVLMAFVFMRAASFHDFDTLIRFDIAGIRMNWIMELSGILLICIQAAVNLRKKKMVIIKIPEN